MDDVNIALSAGAYNFYGMDAMFIPYSRQSLPSWLSSTIVIINEAINDCPLFYQATLWIPVEFYPSSMKGTVQSILLSILPDWRYTVHRYNAAAFGDSIAAYRVGIKIFRVDDTSFQMEER